MRRFLLSAALMLAGAFAAAQTPPPPPGVVLPTPVYGVTLDNVSNISGITSSLSRHVYKPTARIVLDPGTSVATYRAAILQIRPYAFIVAEVLDSYYFPTTLSAYTARTQALVNGLNDVVDVWEIANEINGGWLRGADRTAVDSVVAADEATIGQMVASASNIVKAAGGKTMVTLYYNEDSQNPANNCYDNWQDSWHTWPNQFLSAAVRSATDYVAFSYYPYIDCPGLSPTWSGDFAEVEGYFPNAKVMFGEVGTSSTAAPQTTQDSILTTYYAFSLVTPADPKYVLGGFWWNYYEEMIPYTGHYWQELNSTWAAQPVPH